MNLRLPYYTFSLFILLQFIAITSTNAQVKIPQSTLQELDIYKHSLTSIAQNSDKIKTQGAVLIGGKYYLSLQGFVNEKYDRASLEKEGIIISSKIGKAISLKIPLEKVASISELEGIAYLERPIDYSPLLDKSIGDVRADSVHAAINLSKSYSGKEVIMGIIDWGYDFTHPMFYDTSLQRNRILAAWDHWKLSGPAPSKYGYGTEYNTVESMLEVGSDTANDRGYDTHGSHVAGIAGGGGAGIGIKGVAYDCDFLFVQVDWRTGTFLDCVDWMYEKAKSHGKRLVINMSFGSYHRATLDTTSFFNEVIKMYTQKGVVMITSAGNNGNNKMHIKKEFNQDTMNTQVSMLPTSTTFARYWGHNVISWGEAMQSYSSAIAVYDNTNSIIFQSEWFNTANFNKAIDTFILINQDTLYYKIEGEKQHPLNNKPNLNIKIRKTNDNWRLALSSSAEKGTVHYWNVIQNTNGTSNTGQPFLAMRNGWLAGNDSFAVSDPAVVPHVISIAAHNPETRQVGGNTFPGAIAGFSSRGPTMDGLIKPDVSGPGVGILSAVSSFTTQSYQSEAGVDFNNKNYPFARFSGTSMSGPAVAGVAALLLEANPSLSHSQIHQILTQTAREDIRTGNVGPNGNNTWGKGKVDAYAAIQLALLTAGEYKSNQENVLYPNPSNNVIYYSSSTNSANSYQAKIYDMQGKLVIESTIDSGKGLNIQTLTKGVYIVRILDQNWVNKKLLVN